MTSVRGPGDQKAVGALQVFYVCPVVGSEKDRMISCDSLNRERVECCFESTVSEKRTHCASLSFTANSVSSAKKSSHWHTHTHIIG